MESMVTRTVREIALEMPVTTRVFEEFKIDYCCGGRKPFLEACRIANADPETVLQKLEVVIDAHEPIEHEWLKTTSLAALIDYICEKHHVFTRAEIANLTPLAAKVADRHGREHPELFELKVLFDELGRDLTPHLIKEEQVLFPYIKRLETAPPNSSPADFACFGTVRNPVRAMMTEHDTAGDILRQMRELSMDYKLPDDACPSFTALYSRLEAFEKDLHQHIHLENNLLFPRAVELEEKVSIGN